jgi:hypothetical protein
MNIETLNGYRTDCRAVLRADDEIATAGNGSRNLFAAD